MKSLKIICFFAAVIFALAAVGCSSNTSEKLVGAWQTEVDILDMLKAQFASDPSTADLGKHITADEFNIVLYMVFYDDGTYAVGLDEEAFNRKMQTMLSECIEGYLYEYFEQYIAEIGLEGSVDEILADLDIDIDAMAAQSISEVDIAGIGRSFAQSGNYSAFGEKLYRSSSKDSLPDPSIYEVYSVKNDVLTLFEYVNNGVSESSGYPIVFFKVA